MAISGTTCGIAILSLLLSTAASVSAQDAGGAAQKGSGCPPEGFDSVANFNVSAYISAPWFVQKQTPMEYQQPEELHCVRAVYKPRDKSDLSQGLRVFNSANKGSASGPPTGTQPIKANGNDNDNGNSDGSDNDKDNRKGYDGGRGAMDLIAVPDPSASGPTAASKFLVGPKPVYMKGGDWKKAFGPYWVVAVGPSNDTKLGYDWAIVSGGAPTTATANGCRTGSSDKPQAEQYYGGLWLLSRKPQDPEAASAMEKIAKQMGLDTSGLLPVNQEGCKYPSH